MKLYTSVAALVAILALVAYLVWPRPDYSLEHWREISRYAGPVCLVTQDGRHCADGVQYSRDAEIAGESYQIWLGCEEYHSPYDCQLLNN
ncbi:hypothetical protein [Ktedonobacter robiniae]|uniref:Uncharacterized protein n=1 Tax=Ktedonobacter robiniae TaxID=2778365 RepID=A0ABQ3US38_9CHLR|nr:hypothetical protein [Ktedonobacter robiniae]GHO55507.1 hypothetical protein KSB_39820 [Ktedonobacter robiniae]